MSLGVHAESSYRQSARTGARNAAVGTQDVG